MTISWVAISAGVLGVAAFTAIRVRRDRRNLDDVLRPMVEDHGLEFIDSRPSPRFQTGPFPLIAARFGTLHTQILGVRGEYWTDRIVRVRSATETKEVWVRLYFQAFRFHDAEWKPPLATLAA